MLRLPTVGRALAGAAKSSLAPSNTGSTDSVCVCKSYILFVCSLLFCVSFLNFYLLNSVFCHLDTRHYLLINETCAPNSHNVA